MCLISERIPAPSICASKYPINGIAGCIEYFTNHCQLIATANTGRAVAEFKLAISVLILFLPEPYQNPQVGFSISLKETNNQNDNVVGKKLSLIIVLP